MTQVERVSNPLHLHEEAMRLLKACKQNGLILSCVLLVCLCTKAVPPLSLVLPNGLALDARGNLYISDIGAHCVFRLTPTGKLIVIAGTGSAGFSGDGGLATKAELNAPHDLAFDATGNLFIADTGNSRIRKIDRHGRLTTIAGNEKDALNNPQSIAFDAAGHLLIADTYNHVIRRLDKQGTLTTIAGTEPGHGGDGGPATKAQINLTMAVTAAPDGNVFVSDAANSRIRQITPDGIIKTIIGYGPAADTYGGGYAGDDGPAVKGKIFSATDLKYANGKLWIVDSGNHRIRVVENGIIKTVAGAGQTTDLNSPQKIAVARDGSFYISDRANARVLHINARGMVVR
jgi:sugar lactone lactonase YvrE